ncbi:MAG: 2OG-Fe(II) oxygenase [Pseudomonadota bacterium]|nr:2OG-Fe(II) oxygenase [Pseudomonadota bacterium]
MTRTALRRKTASPSVAECFMACLDRAEEVHRPFQHWLLEDVLPEDVLADIANLPFAPPQNPVFDGRRESNNASRVFFTPENQAKYFVCREVASVFDDPTVVDTLEKVTGANLRHGSLRIEYCQDANGFWLAPHLNLAVKQLTMMIYLSEDPALLEAGTELYDGSAAHECVATVPYERGKGFVFVPGRTTWHGLRQRPIQGLRKTLVVNYVSPDWESKDQLS